MTAIDRSSTPHEQNSSAFKVESTASWLIYESIIEIPSVDLVEILVVAIDPVDRQICLGRPTRTATNPAISQVPDLDDVSDPRVAMCGFADGLVGLTPTAMNVA